MKRRTDGSGVGTIPSPRVLPQDPSLPAALAAALQQHQAGRLPEAERGYRAFLQFQPRHAQALQFLGVLAAQVGKLEVAVQLVTNAIHCNADLADARFALGCIRLADGDAATALTLFTQAVVLEHPDAASRLETLLGELGMAERARSKRLLAELLLTRGRVEQAFAAARDAIRLAPDDHENWVPLGRCLTLLKFNSRVPEETRDLLVAAFSRDGIDHQNMVRATISGLRHEPGLAALYEASNSVVASPDAVSALLEAGTLQGLAGDRLLLKVLETALVTDHRTEHALTWLRRALLQAFADTAGSAEGGDVCLPLACALAHQCFLNEYVFAQEDDELRAVTALAAEIIGRLAEAGEVPAIWVALLASYRPLYQTGGLETLIDGVWPESLRRVLVRQLTEPEEEQRLRAAMPRFTPIEDGVSGDVREQYEENPFPRWLTLPAIYQPVYLDDLVRGWFPHMAPLLPETNPAPEILVAGCGTGQSPITLALQLKGGRVTAVDLSLASLAYGKRKAAELGIGNIEFGQADILNLHALGRQFDHINCFGVLHHLEDPLAGWRVLTDLLKPGSVMLVGLYSEIARRAVVRARDRVATRGYTATATDMRRSRTDIRAATDDPELQAIADAWAFFSMSNYRDLVFHVQEHRHSLPEIGGMLRELGLEFVGFEYTDPTVPRRYHQRFPEDTNLTDLSCWHQFEVENPSTFGSCYRICAYKPRD